MINVDFFCFKFTVKKEKWDFKNLELNLGKRYMFDADNFHKVPCFRRINSIELKSKPELGMVIQDFGIYKFYYKYVEK
jgi:hypothetical protein